MARPTSEIFNDMVAEKQRHTALSTLNSSSTTAVWRLMLYIVAYCAHVLEVLWDTYQAEVNAAIEQMLPHRPKWYRDKVLAFMADKTLIPDTDRYDTSAMTDEQVAAAMVIKHAVVTENDTTSLLTIKVAGEQDSVRCPISAAHETQLTAYIQEIKDAGVRFIVVNQAPDVFNCTVAVWYDPMRDPDTVQADCETAIRDYIENLPFNGEYTNMDLIDALQGVEGVRIAELTASSSAPATTAAAADINARVVPDAGYFTPGTININLTAYR